ncbi:MAG: hypothetical protein HKN87_19230 [Saprospiraceae bacterium]|nr:hypothetical protein [Saprospiraceae bacterium]
MGADIRRNPYRCIYYLLSVEEDQMEEGVDRSYLDLVTPLRDHPRYPALLKSQRKLYQENVRKFSAKGKL